MSFLKKLFGRKEESPSAAINPELLAAAEETFKVIDAHLKNASVAEVGGFPALDDPFSSWFGTGVMLSSESIPEYEGEPMFPLLQVNCSELPYIHPELEGVALFVVWFTQEDLPFDRPHGDGWLIREYRNLEGLVPVQNVSKPKGLKSLPIKWTLVENEGPEWGDAWDMAGLSALIPSEDEPIPEAIYEYYDERFTRNWGTKIGGYSTTIQSPLSQSQPQSTFVFQIAAEPKANWDWVDNGVAYFLKDQNGRWVWEVQFS